MELKKTLLAMSVISVLSACGGSSDKQTETPTTPTTPPPDNGSSITSNIAGAASKGTLKNAALTFYKYVDGNEVELNAEELGDSSLLTDENGEYAVTLNNVSGVVKVEISASQDTSSPTLMVCDAPVGCGTNNEGAAIAYGEDVNLTVTDPEFSIATFFNVADEQTDATYTANITPLTHMAMALAQSRGDTSEQAIQEAKSQIANVFGLVGALDQLQPGKLEKPASLFGDDNKNSMRYALINAGIANSLYSEQSDLPMSSKLNSAITDLTAADGAFLVANAADDDDEFELTIEDVLNGSRQAITELTKVIADDPNLAQHVETLEQTATNIANEIQVKVAKADNDGRVKGKASDETQGDAIAKASAMVDDVRLFANLFDVTNSSGEDFTTEGEKFVSVVDTAGQMVAEQGDSFALLSDVMEAITQINLLRESGELQGTQFNLGKYLTTGGTGTVTLDEENLVFSVTATAGSESLTADISITALENDSQYKLALSGKAENDAAQLIISDDSHATISLDRALTRAQIEAGDVAVEPTKGELKLAVTLAQKATDSVTNPVSFAGSINAELLPVEVPSVAPKNYREESAFDYHLEKDTLILPQLISLSGEFSTAQDEFVKATATININDLEQYMPPELSGFGKKFEDVATITVDDTGNNLTVNESSGLTTVAYQYQKTAATAGNYRVSIQQNSSSDMVFAGDILREAYNSGTRQYYLLNFKNEKTGAQRAWVEYIDFNDAYGSYQLNANFDYFTNFSNGVLSYEDGNQIAIDDLEFVNNGNFYSMEEAESYVSAGVTQDPESALGYFKPRLESGYSTFKPDTGWLRLISDGVSDTLKPNTTTSANGYLVSPILEDKLTIDVNSDNSNLVAQVEAGTSQAVNVSQSNSNDFAVSHTYYTQSGAVDSKSALTVASEALDVGQNLELEQRYYGINEESHWGEYKVLSPILSEDQQRVEYYSCRYINFTDVNNDGNYVDGEGRVINFAEEAYDCGTYEDLSYFISQSWMLGSFGINGNNINAITATDTFVSRLSSYRDYYRPLTIQNGDSFQFKTFYGHIKGLGRVAADFTAAEQVNWQAGASYSIDMYLAQPELGSKLESEDVYLDINAALNFQAKVSDYEMELNLSGERTAYENGELELDISYVLPESDKLRTFTVNYDTATTTLTANNAEGVKLSIANNDDNDNTDGQVVLGTIMVADEKAAEVVKRDGLVLIVYENGTVETL
ncbi:MULTISPECIES: hypothetical protein [unclassified Pseudoalteromonas]|uniref:hypothetical protein n=1 Tax=unclassified Pseudoalteromonas TaxID=194690 RepID=UPI0030143F94